MNNEIRAQIKEIIGQVNDLAQQAAAIGSVVSGLAEEEQDKFDNLSEGLQQGEKGEILQQAADTLSEAAQALEEGNLNEALNSLSEIE